MAKKLPITKTREHKRLQEDCEKLAPWKMWGPYLSERQWGTVREDYSEGGDAWNYFTHDQARSRAYRWGEDGIAGISDDKMHLCFALALWNGKDPILKERLFGLNNSEGNHGEDVKEYYFYLDSTPTHSYMKCLYKYPQQAYPYSELVQNNAKRGKNDPEFELLDTGIFNENRYFDIFTEYAKAGPEDMFIRITAANRGPDAAELHCLPTLWFRNNWSSWIDNPAPKPRLERIDGPAGVRTIKATHAKIGDYYLYTEGDVPLLFTENETNNARVFPQYPNAGPHVKDGIHECIIHGRQDAVMVDGHGTKVSPHCRLMVPAGGEVTIRLRLCAKKRAKPFADFDETVKSRIAEADDFYRALIPVSIDADGTAVMRQALAGMLWSKQVYRYDVNRWLREHGTHPYTVNARIAPRNNQWRHMRNDDIISMPDKWEYPWYAAWDLAFHVTALTMVDLQFGKDQLNLMLHEDYLHPNGQLPAYEWNFNDANPPVHAWSTIFTYRAEKAATGKGDVEWMEAAFHKLLINFTWWVNQKDRDGNSAVEGGFLGLDNIGVFDRSAPLPTGGHLEQADGTAWMAFFCSNMLEIAAELTTHNPSYLDMTLKFFKHFHHIASSLFHAGNGVGMWDEGDGFFYDILRLPDGRSELLKVRSMVGLLPLCSATVFDGNLLERLPEVKQRLLWFAEAHPELSGEIHNLLKPGQGGMHLACILNEDRLRRVLGKMLDEKEFLSPYGIRSLSRIHADHPYTFRHGDQEHRVAYVPAESDSGMFGGNSNWRGPVWIPVNALIIRALLQYYAYYGDSFRIEHPTGSGRKLTLYQIAEDLTGRLSDIFRRDGQGRRPVYGSTQKFQDDPHWRDHILFYEYFHGDNGAGIGASHQTGWTGVIARLMHLFATATSERILKEGKMGVFEKE